MSTMKKVLDEFNELIEQTNEHYAVILIKVMMNLIVNSKGTLFICIERDDNVRTHSWN